MSHDLKGAISTISADCVIFGFEQSRLEVLLVKRAIEPEEGAWALPGGFVKLDERIYEAAVRVLHETTGVGNLYLEDFGVFDDVHRYPLWRVITHGYFALISPENYALHSGIDTSAVQWFPLDEVPTLPFDHTFILAMALEKLRARVRYRPIGFELLPGKFTLPQLQTLYECILGKKLDKRNFRKKVMSMNLVKKLKEKDKNNTRRAAYLNKFDKKNYDRLKRGGFIFDL